MSAHKTAIKRNKMSGPTTKALQHIFAAGQSVLDYGCGRGDDVEALRELGFNVAGYDPYYAPINPRPADTVLLNYVLNVISNPYLRSCTLTDAWRLARHLMVVAVRTEKIPGTPSGDGVRTAKGTFQKRYDKAGREGLVAEIKKLPGVGTVEDLGNGTFIARRA
jgi:DNA phosphorothioation-associated putative methyltransferase